MEKNNKLEKPDVSEFSYPMQVVTCNFVHFSWNGPNLDKLQIWWKIHRHLCEISTWRLLF